MSESTLLDRLRVHRTLASVPLEQLEWLANAGHLRVLEPGDVLSHSGTPVAGLYVLFDGHLSIRVDRGAGSRIVMEWHGGDVTGVLPYSRLKSPPGNVVAERRTELLMLDREDIHRMIQACHDLTAVMVHVMVDRARVFTSSALLDEKMVSLGRLAAGLAHELNNPASAVARSAKALIHELEALDGARRQLSKLELTDTQVFSITGLRGDAGSTSVARSAIEIADREDALSDWLDEHGLSEVELKPLASMAYRPEDLDAITASVGLDKLAEVLTYISSESTVRQLAAEISMAASRIHGLVAAVKGFTYMDQQTVLQPIAIGRGLSDTITVLGSKARSKSVDVSLDVPADLPDVDGNGGELNQVWANLIDNAIDAAPKGHVRIAAGVELGRVVVRVIDDGPGIPSDIVGRIFDPFFTTKGVGDGTGLGLDIARRILTRHHGTIDVKTNERGTEFRVALPPASTLESH